MKVVVTVFASKAKKSRAPGSVCPGDWSGQFELLLPTKVSRQKPGFKYDRAPGRPYGPKLLAVSRLRGRATFIDDLDATVLRFADSVAGRDQQVTLAFGHD